MIADLFLHLEKHRITPNQYYLLYSIHIRTEALFINTMMELRLLKTNKWITEDNKLTPAAIELLEDTQSLFTVKAKKVAKQVLSLDDNLNCITTYREMFPTGKLPSGSPSRINERELEKKFIWFFNTYPEYASWDMILQVTERYVSEYADRNYLHMRNSGYFIYREDTSKVRTSELATRCGLFLEGEDEVEEAIPEHLQVR